MQELSLYGNNLSGFIPPELGYLGSLQKLNLASKQLNSSIPPEFENLQNLTHLHLFLNQLSGSIPQELSNLENLQILSLQSKQLTGSIPQELGNLENLTTLLLALNQPCGSIPPELLVHCDTNYDFSSNPGLPNGGNFTAFCQGNNPAISVSIDTAICAGDSLIFADSTFTQAGLHSIALVAEAGCDSIVNINIALLPEDVCITDITDECTSILPNVITPTLLDGINDVFDPVAHMEACTGGNIDPSSVEFTVLNRWGNAVFRAKPYKPWDGTNRDNPLPQGSYFYTLQIGNTRLRGSVNLLR